MRRALRVEDAILFTFHAKKKCSAISIRQILRVKDVVLKKYTNYRLAKVFKDGYWNKELYVCKFDIYYRFLFISASLIRNRCLNFQF